MLRTQCIACRYGHHERHVEVVQLVPEGMLGGAMCPCKGECQAPGSAGSRSCSYCEGKGCEECDQTGERHNTGWETPDGMTLHVHGSAPLSPEAQRALEEIARVAFKHIEREVPRG